MYSTPLIRELIYAPFSMLDSTVSTICVVWLCWHYPLPIQRPGRFGSALFGLWVVTPMITVVGEVLSWRFWEPNWVIQLATWRYLWSFCGIAFLMAFMIGLSRVSGISIAKRQTTLPSRRPISIVHLFNLTLAVALFFAIARPLSVWLAHALESFGVNIGGFSSLVISAVQAASVCIYIFVSSPLLRRSIWIRAAAALAIFILGRYVIAFAYIWLDPATIPTDRIHIDLLIETIMRSLSTIAGLILGHWLLGRRGYHYQIRAKAMHIT